jgi:hypothetical protein
VTAKTPQREEAAGTMPFAMLVTRGIIVIVSPEPDGKLIEGDTLRLLGIALGFFYLPDEAGLHNHTSLNWERHWLVTARRLFLLNSVSTFLKAWHYYYSSFYRLSPLKCALVHYLDKDIFIFSAFLFRTWQVYKAPPGQARNPANQ